MNPVPYVADTACGTLPGMSGGARPVIGLSQELEATISVSDPATSSLALLELAPAVRGAFRPVDIADHRAAAHRGC